MNFTEEQLKSYAKPLSKTEIVRCENAINMLSTALENIGYTQVQQLQLEARDTYSYKTELIKDEMKIKLLVQGSYANNTNVKTESDVDVAVIQEDVFNSSYKKGRDYSDYGFVKSSYSFEDFKRDIYEALVKSYGSEQVEWKSKCLLVHGNSYRVDADSVPSRRYRDYTADERISRDNFIPGIYFLSDEGEKIINYPEQHIKNGRDKNVDTNLYYKKIVRIIKKMRSLMKDKGIPSSYKVNSFKIESLLWNIPDAIYKLEGKENYAEKLKGIMVYLLSEGIKNLGSYKEVNAIKPLCIDSEEKNNLREFIRDLYIFLYENE